MKVFVIQSNQSLENYIVACLAYFVRFMFLYHYMGKLIK